MVNKYYIFLLTFLWVGVSLGTSTTDYLEKIRENYQGLNAMELTLEYRLFKGANGQSVRDTYQSVLHLSGEKSHRQIYDDEVITGEDISVIINHQFRTVQIAKPVKQGVFETDLENSLSQCRDIRLTEAADGKQIVLEFKEGATVPYSRVEILTDKDFWVKHVTLFYATQLNFSKSYLKPEWDFPRLEIDYKNMNKNWTDAHGVIDLSSYVTEQNGAYTLAEKYKDYTLVQ